MRPTMLLSLALVAAGAALPASHLAASTTASAAAMPGREGGGVRPPADRIYYGGTVITLDDAKPTAEAVAVKDGRIYAVGTSAYLMKLAGANTKKFEIRGQTLVPGFIDAHGHMMQVGFQAVAANLLPPPDGGVDSIAALQQALRDWIAKSPVSGKYGLIVGFGYDDSQLKEQRHPTRDDLDAVSTTLPIVVIHQSGHLQAYNSRGLELAGVTAATKDPPGGKFRRRAGSQEPDGVAEETAGMLMLPKVLPKLGEAEQLAMLEAGMNLYASFGHTTAQEGRALAGTFPVFEKADREGRLKLDVVAYPDLMMTSDEAMKSPYYGRGYRTGSRFRIGGVKLNLDGSPQGKTAWLSKPYYVVPAGQPKAYAGYGTLTDAQANDAVLRAYRNDWQILTHTNGDAAIDQYIRAVRAAEAAFPGRDVRPVMIHGQTLRADQVPQIKQLGIFPALFPMHTFYWGDWHRDSVLGPERGANISPTGWLLREGMMFTSHHDAPVAFPDTMRVLSATVNRTTRSGKVLGPEHRVEPLVALKPMSLWAAYQHFEEKSKGSIEVGKRADFAILSDNPLTTDRAKLAEVEVLQTIKDGVPIYTRKQPRAASDGASPAAPLACAESARCFDRLAQFRMHAPLHAEEMPHRHAGL